MPSTSPERITEQPVSTERWLTGDISAEEMERRLESISAHQRQVRASFLQGLSSPF